MQRKRQQAVRVRVAVRLSALLFLLAIGSWAGLTFQGVAADSLTGSLDAIQLSADHLTFAKDQPVRFTLSNHDQRAVTLPGTSPFTITRSGEVIYQPFDDPTPTELPAGRSLSWTWNQRDVLGKPVDLGTYDIGVAYALGKTDAAVKTSVVLVPSATLSPGFEVAPSSGLAPLQVTLRCGDSQAPVVASFGDNSDSVLLSHCPDTVSHTYTGLGTYTLTLRSGSQNLGSAPVTILAPLASAAVSQPGPLSPSSLGRLGLFLLVAGVASAALSYLLIGRPIALAGSSE